MKLFVTFGSWGEIAPLLEIALQLQDRGESVAFATTADWAPRVRKYGIDCHDLPIPPKHADTLDGFIGAHLTGRLEAIYDTISAINPEILVAAFYCFPAQAFAEKHGIQFIATTTSPYYFIETEAAAAFHPLMDEYRALRVKLGLESYAGEPFAIVGLYPWYLAQDVGDYRVGFPELRALDPLSAKVTEFIKQPYGVVTRGTLVGIGETERMINAIKAHGLKCLYLGPHKTSADLSVYFDNHREAVKGAKVAITHAGIGTTVDCMDVPMVVDPVGYDQFYNANRLIDLKAAVGVKDSYIKAISEAMKPRSYLPNKFSLDAFLRLFDEHSPSDPGRPAADAGKHSPLH